MLRMAQRELAVHLVAVPASLARLREVAGPDEIVGDLRGGSLRDADDQRDVA
jgi:hypothetical protein